VYDRHLVLCTVVANLPTHPLSKFAVPRNLGHLLATSYTKGIMVVVVIMLVIVAVSHQACSQWTVVRKLSLTMTIPLWSATSAT